MHHLAQLLLLRILAIHFDRTKLKIIIIIIKRLVNKQITVIFTKHLRKNCFDETHNNNKKVKYRTVIFSVYFFLFC